MPRRRGERFRVLDECESFFLYEEKRLGFVLKNLRVSRGWSQADMAEELERIGWPMHQTNVSKIESGKHLLRVADIVAFAKALGIPAAALFFIPADDEPRDVRELREQLQDAEQMTAKSETALRSAAAHHAWTLARHETAVRRIAEAAARQAVRKKGSR
jgi:transcriptional regulator with XRE-family HTH domain